MEEWWGGWMERVRDEWRKEWRNGGRKEKEWEEEWKKVGGMQEGREGRRNEKGTLYIVYMYLHVYGFLLIFKYINFCVFCVSGVAAYNCRYGKYGHGSVG